MHLQPITRHQYQVIQLRQYTTEDFRCTWIRIIRITRIFRTAITVHRRHHRDSDIVRTIMVDIMEAMSFMVKHMVEIAVMEDARLLDSAHSRRTKNLRPAERRHAGYPRQLGDVEDRRNRRDGF